MGLVPSALAPSDLAALVTTRFGSEPGDDLVSLLAGTGGNPFLAVELLAGLADEDRAVVRDGTLELDRGANVPEDLGTRLARRTLLAVPDGELLPGPPPSCLVASPSRNWRRCSTSPSPGSW